MNRKNRCIVVCVVFLISLPVAGITAQEGIQGNGRLSVQGGVGVSGARGNYAVEYDARTEFSFNPGIRLRVDDTFAPNTLIFADLGFLQAGFVGYVVPTETYFYNTYEYLNINAMFGHYTNPFYLAGGLYFGIGLNAYSYKEYEDKWVTLTSNPDFGVVGELGVDIASFLSIGVQGRFGLKSIGSSVDIRNFGILGTIGLHFLRF